MRRPRCRLDPLIWLILLGWLILAAKQHRQQPPAAHDLRVELAACVRKVEDLRVILSQQQAQQEGFEVGWALVALGMGGVVGGGLGLWLGRKTRS